MPDAKEGNISPVREWTKLEKTALTLLTWGNPIAWPAIFSGDYKGSQRFQSWIETAHTFVADHSNRTRQ